MVVNEGTGHYGRVSRGDGHPESYGEKSHQEVGRLASAAKNGGRAGDLLQGDLEMTAYPACCQDIVARYLSPGLERSVSGHISGQNGPITQELE